MANVTLSVAYVFVTAVGVVELAIAGCVCQIVPVQVSVSTGIVFALKDTTTLESLLTRKTVAHVKINVQIMENAT